MALRVNKTAKEVDHLDSSLPKSKKSQRSESGAKGNILKINGHAITLTNQDKVYWPKEGITKGQVLEYYNAISKYILPYLKKSAAVFKTKSQWDLD